MNDEKIRVTKKPTWLGEQEDNTAAILESTQKVLPQRRRRASPPSRHPVDDVDAWLQEQDAWIQEQLRRQKEKPEYLGIYCRYQTMLEDHWIAELEEKVTDATLDTIREKAVKEKDDKAQSLPETLSALRRRGRAIYKKKRAKRYIELMEEFLFKESLKESYTGDPPSKADCEKFFAEETERREKEAKRRQLEAQQRQARLEKVLEQVRVPGGSFTMGCTPEQKNCDHDEKPAHQVQVNGFQIGKYEVTNELWEAMMDSSGSACPQCPVANVSWDRVQEFLKRLNDLTGEQYRLPTEAEWEYAARGGQQSKGYEYVGSNEPGSVAWYNGNSGGKPNRVGKKQPNELGLYDMSGNVREWVQDCWNKTYVGAPNDGSAWEQGNCRHRVLRGGSWNDAPSNLRAANRNGGGTGYRVNYIGFRLARTLP